MGKHVNFQAAYQFLQSVVAHVQLDLGLAFCFKQIFSLSLKLPHQLPSCMCVDFKTSHWVSESARFINSFLQ